MSDQTLDKRILNLIKGYMSKLSFKKVLTSMEEVEANTNETNLVGAPVIAELNNKLSGCSFEQEGTDFYITGADAVRKKLGSGMDADYLSSLKWSLATSSLGGYADLSVTSGKTYFISIVNETTLPTYRSGGTVLFSKTFNGGYKRCIYLIKATSNVLQFTAPPEANRDHNSFVYAQID